MVNTILLEGPKPISAALNINYTDAGDSFFD